MTVPHKTVTWRKSTHSQDDGACVELGNGGGVRDSKNPTGPNLSVSWAALVALAKADTREH